MNTHQITSVCFRNAAMGNSLCASNGLLFVCGRDKEGELCRAEVTGCCVANQPSAPLPRESTHIAAATAANCVRYVAP